MKTSRTHLDWEPLWTEESTFFCFRFFKVCIHFWCMPSLELSFEANHPNESGICGRLWNLPGVYLVLGKTQKCRFVMFEHSSSGGSYLSWMIWAWSPQFRKPPFFQVFPNGAMPIDLSMRLFPHSSPNIISSSFASKDVAMTIKTHIFPDGNRTNFWGNRKYPRRKSHHTVNYMAVSWWVYPQFLDTTMTCCWLYITFHFNYIPWYHPIEYHFFFNSTYSIVFNMPIDWGANPPVWAPTQARFLIGYSP